MPLEDYLTPGEQIRFQSSQNVKYADKLYRVVLTDRRILLYASRGFLFKADDVVTQKLEEMHGIKYNEEGLISKRGIIHLDGKARMDLSGSAGEIKALYQQLMQFV